MKDQVKDYFVFVSKSPHVTPIASRCLVSRTFPRSFPKNSNYLTRLFGHVTRNRKESSRLSCESAAEKIPLATRRNPLSYAAWKDFRTKRPLANVHRASRPAPGFARTTTTVALATGRAYNGPLCFSRMIGIRGAVTPSNPSPGTLYLAEEICELKGGGTARVAREISKKLIDDTTLGSVFLFLLSKNFRKRADAREPFILFLFWN